MRGLIVRFLIGAVTAASAAFLFCGAAANATDYANTISEATSYIENQMREADVAGLSVILVDGQGIAWSASFGYADVAHKIKATGTTNYYIASVSKTPVTFALLQQLERKSLSLDSPLTDYLPSFTMKPRFDGVRAITVRDLLTHHSGIPGDYNVDAITTKPVPGYTSGLISYLADEYPSMPPGVIMVYCNSGFSLAEKPIEMISGNPSFNEVVKQTLFAPLGMDSTSYFFDQANISRKLAFPHLGSEPMSCSEFSNVGGAGSLLTTPEDMAQFIAMILADGKSKNGAQLLGPELFGEFIRNQSADIPLDALNATSTGLGWDATAMPDLDYAGRLCFKDGDALSYHTSLIVLLDQKLGVFVAGNSSNAGAIATPVATKILQLAVLDKSGVHWPIEPYTPPYSAPKTASAEELRAVAGVYVTKTGYDKFEAGDGCLIWTAHAETSSPTVKTLVLRENGCYSEADSQNTQFKFQSASGYEVLTYSKAKATYPETGIGGVKYTPKAIPAAWRALDGAVGYFTRDHPDSLIVAVSPSPTSVSFALKDGLLLMAHSDSTLILDPQDDTLAFTAGILSRKPPSVRLRVDADGSTYFDFAGYAFLSTDSIKEVGIGSERVFTNYPKGRFAWAKFKGEPGVAYVVGSMDRTVDIALHSFVNGQLEASSESGLLAIKSSSSDYHYILVSLLSDCERMTFGAWQGTLHDGVYGGRFTVKASELEPPSSSFHSTPAFHADGFLVPYRSDKKGAVTVKALTKVSKGSAKESVDCSPKSGPALYDGKQTSAVVKSGGWWFTSLAQWNSISAQLSVDIADASGGKLKDVPAGFLNCFAPTIEDIAFDTAPSPGAAMTITVKRLEGPSPSVSVEWIKGGKSSLKKCKIVSRQIDSASGTAVIKALYPELPTVKDATEGVTGFIIVTGKNGTAVKRGQPVEK